MKGVLFVCLVAMILFSCNGNNSTATFSPADTLQKEVAKPAIPTGPPLMVTGDFVGKLPCKDCLSLGRMLRLKENTCYIMEHHSGSADKKKMLAGFDYTCTQDSGLITVRDKDKPIQIYRIIAKDSLLFLGNFPLSKKPGRPNYFIRKS